jgi:PAS domain S-box-containing protein
VSDNITKKNRHAPEFMEALNTFEDGIIIIGDNYLIEYMNQYMKNLFGDKLGEKCHKVIKGSDKLCEWCKYEEILQQEETRHREIYIESMGRVYSISEKPISNYDGTKSKLSVYRDITYTREQENALKTSIEDYQRLFKHVGCGVFISSKRGRFLKVNPTLLGMLGYNDLEEFLSLDLARDVFMEPADRQKYMNIIEKTGKVVNYELKWRRRDGHILHILLTSNVRYGTTGDILGYEGIVVDQTRRKESENKLREAHDFLDKIISCSSNAIMVIDSHNIIQIWNQGAEDIFGLSASEVIGKVDFSQIFSGETVKRVDALLRSERFGGKGKLNSFPLNFVKENGNHVEGNLSANVLYDHKGNEVATVALFVDLKEMLQTERDLSAARQQLLQSEKLAAMGRLTSQIAHELNNPLFGIMNTLELMKSEIPPENKRRRLLDMSISETIRLADMLKKMLSFSRPDQDKRAEIDIHTVIDELLLLYEKRFRENSIKLHLNFDQCPAIVLASKDQLRQVFINMFSNSMYAMPEGGKLEISTEVKTNTLYIKIRDTGTGIKKDNLKKVFNSFFTTKTESVQGVGLGLSVCYGFIKDHDGDIIVDSLEGEWTEFTIMLPLSGKSTN